MVINPAITTSIITEQLKRQMVTNWMITPIPSFIIHSGG